MENKKCENCRHWDETNPPSIGKCSKRNATTIFSDVCSQFGSKDLIDGLKDLFGGVFDFEVKK